MAGTVNVGGGKGFVCRNPMGKITAAHLLDLTEAEVQLGLTLMPMPSNLDDAINKVQNILRKQLGGIGVNTFSFGNGQLIETMREKLHILPEGYRPVPTDDSYEAIASKECKVEQIARYLEDGTIQVDAEIWRAMDAGNQAALLLHEAIYLEYRRAGDTDSRNARRVVANLLSTHPLQPVLNPAVQDRIGQSVCRTDSDSDTVTEFFVRMGEHYPIAEFTKIKGHAVFAQTLVRMSDTFFDGILGRTVPADGETHIYAGALETSIPLHDFNQGDLMIRGDSMLKREWVRSYLALYNSEIESNANDENDPRAEKLHCFRLNEVRDGGWIMDYPR